MRGIGFIDPITKQWRDNPPPMMTSDNKIRQSGYDPDLRDVVLIDQNSWDQIREAVLAGRPELQNNNLNRIQIFRTIANSLKVGAVFQK